MGGVSSTVGGRREVYKVLVGKPERKPRRRWEHDIKMNLQEVGFGEWGGGVAWIDLAEDRDRCRALVNTVMNLGVP
jgi:hypothetical protein